MTLLVPSYFPFIISSPISCNSYFTVQPRKYVHGLKLLQLLRDSLQSKGKYAHLSTALLRSPHHYSAHRLQAPQMNLFPGLAAISWTSPRTKHTRRDGDLVFKVTLS